MNNVPSIPKINMRESAMSLNYWLAPTLSAYYVAIELQVPVVVAIIAGLAVELTGLTANYVTVAMFQWNRANPHDKDLHGPVWLGVLLIAMQLLISAALAVGLAVIPGSQPYAPLGFVLLAAVAYTAGALIVAQQQRELAKAKASEHSGLLKRFWKVVKERNLSKEQGELALLEAGGDPIAAIRELPNKVEQPSSSSNPPSLSEPRGSSHPTSDSVLECPRCHSPIGRDGLPWKSAKAIAGHLAYCTGEPHLTRQPLSHSEPANGSNPSIKSEPDIQR